MSSNILCAFERSGVTALGRFGMNWVIEPKICSNQTCNFVNMLNNCAGENLDECSVYANVSWKIQVYCIYEGWLEWRGGRTCSANFGVSGGCSVLFEDVWNTTTDCSRQRYGKLRLYQIFTRTLQSQTHQSFAIPSILNNALVERGHAPLINELAKCPRNQGSWNRALLFDGLPVVLPLSGMAGIACFQWTWVSCLGDF